MGFFKSLFQSRQSRFIEAGVNGDRATLERVLRKSPDVLEAADGNGRTALWFTVANGHTEAAAFLLERKAKVNPPNCSPLYAAVQRDRVALASALIKRGADVNFVAGDGSVPLAAAIDATSLELVQMLLQAKANANGSSRFNPLLHALRKADNAWDSIKVFRRGGRDSTRVVELERDLKTYQKIAHLLADAGADLRVKGKANQNSGLTVLHYAAATGDVEFVRKGIEKGVDVNAKDEWGVAPLHRAAENGHVDVARLLLERKADVNVKSESGGTPVCLAAWNGHLEVVKVFIASKADLNVRRDGQTPLFYAQKFGTPEVVELLKKHGAVG